MKGTIAAVMFGACAAFAGERKVTLRVPTANMEEFRQVAELAKELGANHRCGAGASLRYGANEGAYERDALRA